MAQMSGEMTGCLRVQGIKQHLQPMLVSAPSASSIMDEIPCLAALATQIEGESVFEGVGELRFKESNRLDGLATELTSLGAEVSIDKDILKVRGLQKPIRRDRPIMTQHDHRLALASSMVRAAKSLEIVFDDGGQCLVDSYPTIFKDTTKLGATVKVNGASTRYMNHPLARDRQSA